MKHSDISAALDALGEKYGITQLHRPNYSGGRVHVQLTTLDRPVIGISLDEAIFTLKNRDELSDILHKHFDNVSKLLCGAGIINACTSGREPTFQLDARDDAGKLVPKPKKPHRRTEVLGDFYNVGEDEFHVRLFAEPNRDGDGEVYWVDFEIFEVIGYDGVGTTRPKFFNRRGSMRSPDPVYSYDDAQEIVEGFVKWDGCTQFSFPDGVHIDSKRHLDSLLAAVSKARELCAEEMPNTYDCRSEYP